MELKYNIISSGSNGNAILFKDYLLIDCGISYSKLKTYLNKIKVICLTHLWLHSDHFCNSTIRKIAFEKPTIKFICRDWLVDNLIELGVNKKNIYVGNIISKSNLILTSPTLITSGNILINHTLTLTSNITFIYSFGDIEINYLKGNDSAMTYFVYLESYTKNINIQNDSNVVVLNSEPFIVKTIFPQYKKNILLIR